MDHTGTPDRHWPVWAKVPGVGIVIGCDCGDRPKKRAARISMQHVWHQSHRRRLRLQPVEYAWPDGAVSEADDGGTPLSTGGYVEMSGHVWKDSGWVRSAK
jgi:hypothetical protein